jgi:hypothetical protein
LIKVGEFGNNIFEIGVIKNSHLTGFTKKPRMTFLVTPISGMLFSNSSTLVRLYQQLVTPSSQGFPLSETDITNLTGNLPNFARSHESVLKKSSHEVDIRYL